MNARSPVGQAVLLSVGSSSTGGIAGVHSPHVRGEISCAASSVLTETHAGAGALHSTGGGELEGD